MKAIKYLVAGLLVMGLAAPAMAQDVNYADQTVGVGYEIVEQIELLTVQYDLFPVYIDGMFIGIYR